MLCSTVCGKIVNFNTFVFETQIRPKKKFFNLIEIWYRGQNDHAEFHEVNF